jgi:predicted nucleotidyltransferase
MSASLNRLSIKAERPLDPLTLHILERVDGVLRGAGISYMLVGATARDLLLFHVYGQATVRATYDLDFAILLDSWEQFETVKNLLVKVPGFFDKKREIHRLHYTPAGAKIEIAIDMIPFGQVANSEQKIEWPPSADVVMNVAAFSDVFASSVEVQINAYHSIPVASLPGLIILKLFAWFDRRDDRDVVDIRRLMESYADAGNLDRLYDEENDELVRVNFDVSLAGAFLLGRDAYRLTDQNTRDQLSAALAGDQADLLVARMAREKSILEDHTEDSAALLEGLLRGLVLRTRAADVG